MEEKSGRRALAVLCRRVAARERREKKKKGEEGKTPLYSYSFKEKKRK